ncbi:MAG: transglycosylase SLT domain-containing protein [Bacteroidaceae bacterium]|nr:transglycosylase SLT domain-containing protein [Bacteroidaceae bacterium]
MPRRILYPLLLVIAFFAGEMIFVVEDNNIIEHISESVEAPAPPPSPYVKISGLDEHFRDAADSIDWDWKLIAAICYTESRFDSTAVSHVGAYGVMQMLPRTLRSLGVPDSLHTDTRTNIQAGARYLKQLERIFRRIKDFDERLNFVLASYNAGVGQVNDAMALAQKYGRDRYKWHNSVDTFLILKQYPEYYNDSVCKLGSFNSSNETLQFVDKVTKRWKRYQRLQATYEDSLKAALHANDSIFNKKPL